MSFIATALVLRCDCEYGMAAGYAPEGNVVAMRVCGDLLAVGVHYQETSDLHIGLDSV